MKAKRIIAIVAVFCVSLFASALVACGKRDLPDQDTPVTYTVTFDYNYDGAPNSGVYKTETVDEGKTVPKPADPTRGGGYVFDGWSTDKAINTSWSFSTVITADVRLYAQWTGSGSQEKTLSGIIVTSNPTKTAYTVGDELDITGLIVTANYSDNTSATVPVSSSMLSGFDMNKSGVQTVTVTYEGKTATFDITVTSDRALSSIEITQNPTVTEYMVGEDLDLTGLVVTAVYDNNTDRVINVTLDMVSGYDKTAAGKQTLTVTYTEDGVTKTADFEVTVTPVKTLTRIELVKRPDKTNYLLGEDLDLTGISVKAYFSDNTNKAISVTSAMVSGFDSTTVGIKTITVSYTSNELTKTVDFTVNVSEKSYTLVYDVGTRGEAMTSETLKLSTLPAGGKKLGKPTVKAASKANGYYFVGWKLGTTVVTAITSDILIATDGATITVVAEYSNMYTVTFVSNGGSAVASQNIAFGGKVQKPADPTFEGHVFLDWYSDQGCTDLWDFDEDTVSGNLTLYAQFGEAAGDGIYLVGSVFDGDLFTEGSARDKAKFKVTQTGTNYRITNITLTEGDYFEFVSYQNAAIDETDTVIADYNTYIAGNAEVRPAIMAIEADNKGRIKVKTLTGAPTGATWTIAFGTNAEGNYATFTLDGYIALRDPSNNNNTIVETKDEKGVIYLRGTFSGDFLTCRAWSSDSSLITTHYNSTDKKYYFTKVYLKKYDDFKVYIGGAGNNGWYGGAYAANEAFELSTTGPNIVLSNISDGYYNIVFENGATNKYLTITPYKNIVVTKKTNANIFVGSVPTNQFTVQVDGKNAEYTVVTTDAAESGTNTVKLLVGNAVVEYEYNATEVVAERIEIETNPSKTNYYVGDTIVLTGIKVVRYYNSGKTEIVPVIDCTAEALPTFVDVADKLNGSETIDIEITTTDGLKATFPVTVKNKLTGITLTTTNVKNSYFVGDTLDKTNLAVTAVFNNNNEITQSVALSNCAIEADLTSAGNKQVTVTFNGQTAYYPIEVKAVVLESITVTLGATMPSYTIGQTLTKTGITVTAHYNNGDTNVVVDYTLSADMNTANTTPVTVSYTEGEVTKTYTFDINVAPLTVTFQNQDGTTFKTVTVNTFSTAIAEPSDKPTRDHYTFDKWVLLSNDEFDFDNTLVERDYTLKPTWTANVYTVTFDKNGADEPDSAFPAQNVTYPNKATAPTVTPTKAGHTFVGWVIGSETGAAFNFGAAVTGNVTLVAKWSAKNVYTVTFYDTDNSVLSTQGVEDGETATSYTPEKIGYTFGGWQKAGAAFDFTTPITGATSLFATWTLNTYTITYNPNNGTLSGVTDNKQEYTVESDSVTLATPTRDGYMFAGWFTNINDPSTQVESVDLTDPKNYNLTAKWTVLTFTVTFNSNGGSAVTGSPFTVNYGDKVTKPSNPTRAGYEFKKWCVDSTTHIEWVFAENTVTEDIELVAHWEIINYTITYYTYDGTVTPANPTKYTVTNGTVDLNDAEKRGYTFDGWFTSADDNGTEVTALTVSVFGGGKSITLHAHYTQKTYAVTFDLNYEDADILEPVIVNYGATVSAPDPAPTRDDYTLVGWFTDKAFNNEWDFDTEITDSNTTDDNKLTLYARWTPKTKQNGVYANGQFVKELVPDGDSDTKLMVMGALLKEDDVITFWYNKKQVTKNVWVRGGSAMDGEHISGDNYDEITVHTSGYFNIYYNPSDNSWEGGLWVTFEGAYVESNLKPGDGLYNGDTKIIDLVLNADGVNEAKTDKFDLTEETTIKVIYGGEQVRVVQKDNCPIGTFNDDGTVTLGSGTDYEFYLRYSDNALWINGTPDVPVSTEMTINFSVDGIFDSPIKNVKIHAWGSGDYTTYNVTEMTGTDGYNFTFTVDWDAAKGNIKGVIIMFQQGSNSWTAKSTDFTTDIGAGQSINITFVDWNNTIYGEINWSTWSSIPFDMEEIA
ncbi:MAG: hypothetical protein HDT28_02135 [Clostridiales bacterium]|nr:hypothetical protein [Clostridiales bacterium]